MIAQDAFLFKVGWKDWVAFEQCQTDFGLKSDVDVEQARNVQFIDRAPRATIEGQVIVHNNGDLLIGKGVNISATGVFIETSHHIFKIGETLHLTCRIHGIANSFNAKAIVMRFNKDLGGPLGYGLRFDGLDDKVAAEIQWLVDQTNTAAFQKSS